jgi:hypothetical protein
MKRLLILTVLINLIFVGCDKNDDTIVSDTDVIATKIFDQYGIKPSDPDQINSIITVDDKTEYILAYGKKNDRAWFAKFKSNGDEIFSYELKDELTDELQYSHCNALSNKLLENDKIFLSCFLTDSDDPLSITTNYTAVLVVVDLNTGKENSRLKSKVKENQFEITTKKGFYFLESGLWTGAIINNFYALDSEGKLLWERETNDGFERERGLKGYKQHYFIDPNTICYLDDIDYSGEENGYTVYGSYDACDIKKVNIKDYNLLFNKKITLSSDNNGQEGFDYTNITISEFEGNIKMDYKEKKVITDQISGGKTYELQGEYFITFSSNNGEELSRGKIE